jgi:hypothetical protein
MSLFRGNCQNVRLYDIPNVEFKNHLMPARFIQFGYDFGMAADKVLHEQITNVRKR